MGKAFLLIIVIALFAIGIRYVIVGKAKKISINDVFKNNFVTGCVGDRTGEEKEKYKIYCSCLAGRIDSENVATALESTDEDERIRLVTRQVQDYLMSDAGKKSVEYCSLLIKKDETKQVVQ